MNTWIDRVGCVLIAATVAATASADTMTKAGKDVPAKMGKMAKQSVFVAPTDIKWMAAPPDLPKGGEIGVLFGDPTKAGPFVVRLRAPDGYKIAPHWHSQDEQLTVISGTMQLYSGDLMNGEPHELTTGSFHFLPAKQHHSAMAKGDTIVQINGNGPFDIHYINAEDNPNPSKKPTMKSAGR